MTNQEALDKISKLDMSECTSSESKGIEIREAAKAALATRIPKPVSKSYKIVHRCPRCTMEINTFCDKYCKHCGQALEWDDNEMSTARAFQVIRKMALYDKPSAEIIDEAIRILENAFALKVCEDGEDL